MQHNEQIGRRSIFKTLEIEKMLASLMMNVGYTLGDLKECYEKEYAFNLFKRHYMGLRKQMKDKRISAVMLG